MGPQFIGILEYRSHSVQSVITTRAIDAMTGKVNHHRYKTRMD